MRIIGGSARGTRLERLEMAALRPMMDRVKEALFNILRAVVPDSRVLDLFSGSGSLGLEALSRGAESCVFVEGDRRLAQLVESNAKRCHFDERCFVRVGDVLALGEPPAMQEGVLPADLVFADPPYAMIQDPNMRARVFDSLAALRGSWIEDGAIMVLHHEPMRFALWPLGPFAEADKRVYGRSQLTFFDVLPGDVGDG